MLPTTFAQVEASYELALQAKENEALLRPYGFLKKRSYLSRLLQNIERGKITVYAPDTSTTSSLTEAYAKLAERSAFKQHEAEKERDRRARALQFINLLDVKINFSAGKLRYENASITLLVDGKNTKDGLHTELLQIPLSALQKLRFRTGKGKPKRSLEEQLRVGALNALLWKTENSRFFPESEAELLEKAKEEAALQGLPYSLLRPEKP